ncbi:MAG: hypothetical protein JST43_13480 [Bacteroidetes bacterium]|nr:hypothetical protein [Bacteroidota bacterium]MBS1541845.1 hypothetical protein [Bacteroidota bacterium]
MSKSVGILFLILFLAASLRAQSTHDFMIGGGLDLLKTDNHALLKKVQIGLEANYFVVRHFSVGIGTEIWTANQKSSFVMGARWYANDKVFARFRGLIGANDASLGLGFAHPLNKDLRLEGIGDYYFSGNAFALRMGIGYILR